MKFVTYLYIDAEGNVTDMAKIPSGNKRQKTVCIKVEADIPNEYFETPMFGVEVAVPELKRIKADEDGVTKWLSTDTEETTIEKHAEEVKKQKAAKLSSSYDEDGIPF